MIISYECSELHKCICKYLIMRGLFALMYHSSIDVLVLKHASPSLFFAQPIFFEPKQKDDKNNSILNVFVDCLAAISPTKEKSV